MSHNPGNKKANKRRKRPAGQSAANKQRVQQPTAAATQAEPTDPSTDKTRTGQPAPRRTSRKAAAQAEAKKKRQLQLIIGGVAAAVVIAVIFILVNRPTSSGVEIDYSDVDVAQAPIVTGATHTARAPIEAPWRMVTPTGSQSLADLSEPSGLIARG